MFKSIDEAVAFGQECYVFRMHREFFIINIDDTFDVRVIETLKDDDTVVAHWKYSERASRWWEKRLDGTFVPYLIVKEYAVKKRFTLDMLTETCMLSARFKRMPVPTSLDLQQIWDNSGDDYSFNALYLIADTLLVSVEDLIVRH